MAALDLGGLWSRRRHRVAGELRTVQVTSPAFTDEAEWVFLAAMFVVLCVIYTNAFERDAARNRVSADAATSGLLPYQVLFRDLPTAEQRMFRQMQEGAAEAVRLRGGSGRWARADALAADGIPPFARDVLDTMQLRWTSRADGLIVNFLGTPAAEGAPAFLILAQEPDPVTGEKPASRPLTDEEHQLLPDGTLLHVTYWKRARGAGNPGLVVDPAFDGWQQIRVKTLVEEMGNP
jgi:hypothetical protein